jgi:hypothetical protein
LKRQALGGNRRIAAKISALTGRRSGNGHAAAAAVYRGRKARICSDWKGRMVRSR